MRITTVLSLVIGLAVAACGTSPDGGPLERGPDDEAPRGALPLADESASEAAAAAHADLSYSGPGMCVTCHPDEATEVHGSVHYQWKGSASDLTVGPPVQGKDAGAMNAYCINIAGNWGGCSSCHVGRGARPEPVATPAQLENIDCLVCHQKEYKRVKVDGLFVPNAAQMAISMDTAVRTVHRPERVNCLQCHALAGGGDAVKRGDLALAHGATADEDYDVHMATTGQNLRCQSCHSFDNHRVAGRGSDLRPRDSDEELSCENCHGEGGPHDGRLARHAARVACQSCHIREYARNADDTVASEATEMHRDWTLPEWNTTLKRFEPTPQRANDVRPDYRFWNGTSWVYNLGDQARQTADGRYPISEPVGDIDDPDSKLWPFKHKTSYQPYAPGPNQLVALDTSVYFRTGDVAAAVASGLTNMGLSASEPHDFVVTEEYQALNHEVMRSNQAARCDDCHASNAEPDLAALGYVMKGTLTTTCAQCHKPPKETKGFYGLHEKHRRYDCSSCHEFSRPERGLRLP